MIQESKLITDVIQETIERREKLLAEREAWLEFGGLTREKQFASAISNEKKYEALRAEGISAVEEVREAIFCLFRAVRVRLALDADLELARKLCEERIALCERFARDEENQGLAPRLCQVDVAREQLRAVDRRILRRPGRERQESGRALARAGKIAEADREFIEAQRLELIAEFKILSTCADEPASGRQTAVNLIRDVRQDAIITRLQTIVANMPELDEFETLADAYRAYATAPDGAIGTATVAYVSGLEREFADGGGVSKWVRDYYAEALTTFERCERATKGEHVEYCVARLREDLLANEIIGSFLTDSLAPEKIKGFLARLEA